MTIHAALGHELAGREVREGLVFEAADRELDDGVLAVLGLDHRERLGAVGGEREVLPGRQQLTLRVEDANAADDQAPASPARVVSAIWAMLVSG